MDKEQCSAWSHQSLELFHLFWRGAYPTIMDADQVKGLMAKVIKRCAPRCDAVGVGARHSSRSEINAQHLPAVVL